MSLWSRIRGAVGGRSRDEDAYAVEEDRIVFRDLARARELVQEARENGPSEMATCQRCGGAVRQVVFTTAGAGEQAEIWRAHPVAVDGWVCPKCGAAAMPRYLSVEESVEFGRIAVGHASEGRFDDAEFWFRRILASWAGYPAVRADLGTLAIARADAATDLAEVRRHRRDAESWLLRALEADSTGRLCPVAIKLARLEALDGREADALARLDRLVGSADTPEPVRDEASALAEEIRSGRAVFTRGAELIRGLLVVTGAPSAALDREARQRLEEARPLLREAASRGDSFAAWWSLGKVEQRLGRFDDSLAAFQRAHAREPDQPDGCRELVAAYLELGRAAEAAPIARIAVSLRPDDAGLRCNLALVLLFAGDVDEAKRDADAALAMDPADSVTRAVVAMIDDVRAGRRTRPRSLAEAEGRR